MTETSSESRATCLVVEDDDVVRDCLSSMLTTMGCRVEAARDGIDATSLLEANTSPDFILLDMTMPRLDGEGLLCWLETHRPDLIDRVVLMTGSVAGPTHSMWEQSHLPKLHKPLSWDRLERSVEARATATKTRRKTGRRHGA